MSSPEFGTLGPTYDAGQPEPWSLWPPTTRPARMPVQRRGPGRQPLINRVVLAGLRSPLHRRLACGDDRTSLPADRPRRGHPARHVCHEPARNALSWSCRRSTAKTWWRHFLDPIYLVEAVLARCVCDQPQVRRSPPTPPSTPPRLRPTGRDTHISGRHRTRSCWSPSPRFPPRLHHPQPDGDAHSRSRCR